MENTPHKNTQRVVMYAPKEMADLHANSMNALAEKLVQLLLGNCVDFTVADREDAYRRAGLKARGRIHGHECPEGGRPILGVFRLCTLSKLLAYDSAFNSSKADITEWYDELVAAQELALPKLVHRLSGRNAKYVLAVKEAEADAEPRPTPTPTAPVATPGTAPPDAEPHGATPTPMPTPMPTPTPTAPAATPGTASRADPAPERACRPPRRTSRAAQAARLDEMRSELAAARAETDEVRSEVRSEIFSRLQILEAELAGVRAEAAAACAEAAAARSEAAAARSETAAARSKAAEALLRAEAAETRSATTGQLVARLEGELREAGASASATRQASPRDDDNSRSGAPQSTPETGGRAPAALDASIPVSPASPVLSPSTRAMLARDHVSASLAVADNNGDTQATLGDSRLSKDMRLRAKQSTPEQPLPAGGLSDSAPTPRPQAQAQSGPLYSFTPDSRPSVSLEQVERIRQEAAALDREFEHLEHVP